ncbi:tetratricopeptide repeat protein 28 [Nematostella vectensis]|uniref:tetratricopeptide repeat protein 28 n=1 Tax=Nematostella vectensis TaxID=45351 RepID=UPI002077725D|nr:tetratricopeptide repeat protein 28 [Nematostella vectensis]XP_048588000.1 tetratricopeptide repeat protein 28 [Nematostella vectensis]XP_048588001.1 tetratricopeptide repeat protein 28 [Nematostella vectensis]XP_048588002.1 tetratricopeptide repeat protein 28 [Nematostella vectensis]XP_048588003.1 tetratricopeptide repeat protein 28 [Nematostella vectensis]XP_048588004.1 tetratricopeptide repeat protein 28 [Nematostella vectensis]
MDNEGEPFTHWDVAELERVQRVRPNLPVIFWFLLIWGTEISPLTPAQQIQLLKVCYDIAFLLRDSEMMVAVYGSAGKVYREMRLFDQALACLSTALEIAKAIGSIELQAKCFHDMGSTYIKLHNYNKALDYYKQSLNAYMKTGEERGQANVYKNIGTLYMTLGDNGQAMVNYKHALCIYEKFGEERKQADVYNNIGVVFMSLGDNSQAMENYKHALCIYEKFGEEREQADVYSNIGNTYYTLGDNGQAMVNYKNALCIYEKFGEELKQADVYNNIGFVFMSLGDNGQAMENYKHALCIHEKFGEELKQADVYSNIGAVFKSLGDNGQAMENYKHALCIYEKLGEERKQAYVYFQIGAVFKSLGDNGRAMENYKHALCILEKFGEECRQADVYNNIGAVFYSLGDDGQAMMNYKKALCIFRKFEEEHGLATACGNIANIARFYDPVEAMELYRSALALFQKHGDVIRQAETWHNIGIVYLNMSEDPEAEKSLKESLRLFELVFMNLGSLEKLKITVIETYIKTYRCLFRVSIILDKPEQALLASEQGRSRALKDSLQKKYGLESNAPSDEDTRYTSSLISEDNTSFVVICLSLEWLHLFTLASGKPLVTESVPKEIFSSVESEINGKEWLRDYIDRMVNEANAHVRLNRDESFEDRSLRLSCDDDGDESRQPSVLARGVRTATEIERARKSTEVRAEPSENSEDGNFPETSSTNSQATGGTQNQPQLPTQAPMSQATGIPQESDAITSVKVPQEHEDDTCTPLLPSGPETPIHHDPLEVLYRLLISPIEDHLTGPEVVFIPEDFTFKIPFGAMKDPDGRFLAERKRIRTGPSLSTLKLLRECPEHKHSKQSVLVVANPRSNVNVEWPDEFGQLKVKPFSDTFAGLPKASEEAKMIRDLLPDVTCLMEKRATKNAILAKLKEGVGIIHIASHGNARTGKILVAPGPRPHDEIAPSKDFLLTLEEIYSCQINARLVVLCCCHSGTGEIRAEGVMGLTRAFLAAGARSVLATLWQISDEATLYFMKRFYGHLVSGLTASASLQQTIRDTIADKDKYSHPYYWGAFILVGDDVTLTGCCE